MNFYGISKFTAKITKRSLLTLFIRVYCYANNPLELLLLLTRGPWPVGKNRGRLHWPLAATRLASGEGDVGGNGEEAEPHPLVYLARWERAGEGGSAEVDDRRRRGSTARVLRWTMVDEKRSES